jgi:O-antigen/teichoic acid export membrane protein
MGSRAARLVATLFVLAWWPDVRAVAATYALEGTLELALGAWAVYVRRGARPVRPDAETLRAYWAYARPLLVTSPIGLLQDSLDRVLVARWAGLQAAGYYQVARGLWEVLGTLNAQPFNLLFARLSQLFARRDARGDEEARRLFTSAVDKLLFLAVPAGFLLWALRAPVIGLLYGPAFLPAQGALMIFVLAAIAQAAVNPYHFVIYALEQHARFIPVVFVRFGLYLATMVVAVPMWGGSGAAAVRLLLVLVPAWVFVRWTRELAGIGVERVTWVYAAGFGLLVLVSEGMRAALAGVDAPLAIPAAILVATAVYAGWLRLAHPGAGAHLRYARGLVWPPGWAGRGS